jgi:tetratricopeptide (TPR) repeat protein
MKRLANARRVLPSWTNLRRSFLAGAICPLGALGALAQTPPTGADVPASPSVAPAASGVASPTAVLMKQANYWHLQNKDDLALEALRRILLIDPGSVDALALSAQLHVDRGDRSAAQAELKQLQQINPGDARLKTVEQALQVGPLDAVAVAQARDLARQGKSTEAIEQYRALFHGGQPPDSLAVEYYQLLAGTESGWAPAKVGLAQFVTTNAQDMRGQLSYAETLTYRPASRADGISRLEILAKNPATAETATAAWRQALVWLPVDASSVPLYKAYLATHADDANLAQRLADAQNTRRTPQDAAGIERQRGFDALAANRLGDADTAFRAALAVNARDADALGGLGLVQQRQGHIPEARDLLERAIAAAPDKAAQWQPALSGLNSATELSSARALARSGQFVAASEQLRTIIGRGGEVTGAQAALADVQSRSGDLSGAEASYRAVLSSQPNNAGALIGLAGVLNRRGRSGEAEALMARADATGQQKSASQSRAQQLRQQAQQTADPDAAISLLREASAAAPSDPWLRLDLARAMAKQGNAAEGRAVMAALTDAARPSTDALHAAALFALEDKRPGEAATLAERIPARSRSTDMTRLLATAKFEQTVRQVVADSAISGDARQRLLVLASSPDPDGTRGAIILRAFASLNDPAGARRAVALELAANRNPTPSARLAYAGALMEAGQTAEAGNLVSSLDVAGSLTAEQSKALAGLRDGLAIRSSDQLNQEGQTAEAYDQLSPALRQSPDDPDLNLALGRLYQSARDPRQALNIAQALLRREPSNMNARRAAVSAAIELGDLQVADNIVTDSLASNPDDPRSWLMSADLARARGNNRRVLADLHTAQNLRRQQMGLDPAAAPPGSYTKANTPSGSATGGNPFRSGNTSPPIRVADASGLLPSTPTGPMLPADDMGNDIAKAIVEAQAEVAPTVSLGVGVRERTGSTGLDKLNEVTTPLTASYSPGGYGRLTMSVTPTILTNGQLSGATGTRQQFGSLVLNPTTVGNQYAQGVGLSSAYKYRWAAVDFGSTPIGFRVHNTLGGLELAPELTNDLRLRLTAERRAVTDSLLSYAGTVDPGSNLTTGGVVRSRGFGKLELSVGLANFYAGGGYSQLAGKNVATNNETELGAGGSYPVYRNATDELRVGLDLVYFAYANNLRYFTLGQGGYFSPQSYFAALLPVSYTQRLHDLSWSVGGSVGVQNYAESSSLVFPNDPNRQASLYSLAGRDPTIVTAYPSDTNSGLVGGVHASLDYQVAPSLRIGGVLRYDRAGNWNETQASVFARYIFNSTQ